MEAQSESLEWMFFMTLDTTYLDVSTCQGMGSSSVLFITYSEKDHGASYPRSIDALFQAFKTWMTDNLYTERVDKGRFQQNSFRSAHSPMKRIAGFLVCNFKSAECTITPKALSMWKQKNDPEEEENDTEEHKKDA
jgi:hypothetical protein